MPKYSLVARVYILATVAIGALLIAAQVPDWTSPNIWLGLFVALLACASQIRKVTGPTPDSYYDIGLAFYGFALVALGLPEAIWISLLAGLADWAWRRDHWLTHLFNIGMFVIAMEVAGWFYAVISGGQGPVEWTGALAVLVAILSYTFVNHVMLGAVIYLASGQNLGASGTFDYLILAIDATLFGLGIAAALVWRVNPFLIYIAALPIYLIYTALRVPSLQRKADTDPKTGLYNVRYFNRELEKEMARAERYDRPLAVVMADMDLLRVINNKHGHLAGDAVLLGVAKVLRGAVREDDVVARFGGEEFIFLFPETTPRQALARANTMRRAIERTEYEIPNSAIRLRATMSFGVAARTRPGQTGEELVHNADLAVYRAKSEGRNRACLFDETLPRDV